MTTTRPTEYDNLIKTRALEEVQPTPGAVGAFLRNAGTYQQLAQSLQASCAEPMLVFTNAYEGYHMVVQAVLEHFEVRTKDSGRNLAILRVSADLELAPHEVETARRAHETRNRTSYRTPYPPISRHDAQAILDVLDKAVPIATALVASSLAAAPIPAPTQPVKK